MTASKHRILVIDDDDEIRRLIQVSLSSAGFEVELAEDGESGLARIRECRPDLLLLDMVMPGMNGWGVLRRLPDETPSLPVVAMSGEYVSPAALGASRHVRAYVMKPLRVPHLVRTCESILRTNVAEAAPRKNERRREMRSAVFLSVTILDDARRPLAVGRATNLSPNGVQLFLGADLVEGQEVQLAITSATNAVPIHLRALTRWASRGFVGLSFVHPSAEASAQLAEILGRSGEASGEGP
jgi:DNA-binding response OmpR family regulator